VKTSSQAPPSTRRTSRTSLAARTRGSAPHSLGLTHPDDIVRYDCLSCRTMIASRYYDGEFLAHLGLLDDLW